jgi:hypothetical protein
MDIYSDIVDQEKVSIKRLRKSIGWVEPTGSVPENWDVTIEGGGFSCGTQIEAEILSELVQIHERIKRLEKKTEG